MRPSLAVVGSFISLAGLVGSGCATEDDPTEVERYLSPLDGQTGWDPSAPLTAVATDLDLPSDYPLPELIRVVDLETDGLIPGRVERSASWIRFFPDEPLPAERRYAWTVDVPDTLPHGPELRFPQALMEPAIVSTESGVDALAASIEADGRVCVVMSRLLTEQDTGTWTWNVEGTSLAVPTARLVPITSWPVQFELPAEDPGVDVLCFDPQQAPGQDPDDTDTGDTDEDPEPNGEPPPNDRRVQVGDTLRLDWGGRGPWTLDVEPGPYTNAVLRLRRGDR